MQARVVTVTQVGTLESLWWNTYYTEKTLYTVLPGIVLSIRHLNR